MIRKSILICTSLSAILLADTNTDTTATTNSNIAPIIATSISNVEIIGYGNEEETKKLQDMIGVKRGDLYEESTISKAKEIILAKLSAEGVQNTTVTVTNTKVGTSGMSVIFDVKKGEKVKIQRQVFNGAKALSHDELEKNLANKEEDFLGWLPLRNDGVAHPDQLEADAFRVKDAYMKHGYLDAQVSRPTMKTDSSNNAEIEYNIKEGNRYKNGNISVEQSVEELNTKKLEDGLKLKKGKYFNIDIMRNDIKFLQEQVGNLGYAMAKIEPKVSKNDASQIIDLSYVITAGEKVKINDVLISGNESTQDKVVRRYIYLAPGDTFSVTDLKDSKNALGRTGYFESAEIIPQPNGADKIDLLVKVKEAPTGSIAIGGGYGSDQGAMLNGSLSDRNLLGTGIDASISADVSKISTNVALGITNPRLWDSEYSLALDLFKKQYEYDDYTLDQTGASLTLGRQFMRHYYAYAGLGYADNQSTISSNSVFATSNPLLYSDKYSKISGLAGIKFDNTDDFYVPRDGFIASAGVELAQLGGTINADQIDAGYTDYGDLAKFNAKFGAYYGLNDLINYDLILRYKARYSKIVSGSGNGYIPVSERLFMGGNGSVRGFDAYSISPQRTIDIPAVPATSTTPEIPASTTTGNIGGTQTFSNSIEASIPISEEAKIRLALFADYGTISTDNYYGTAYPSMSRQSVGATIEWFSPFGPVNFIFAKAINPEPLDKTATFEFSMGTKF